ncbi:MAG: transglycosylase SLT domain-containing protein [Acidobacteriota bacterium]|nr:transglycosylase SLT domain-containing protein [Acidobacteriota bacterium]
MNIVRTLSSVPRSRPSNAFRRKRPAGCALALALLVSMTAPRGVRAQRLADDPSPDGALPTLAPTVHPPLPEELSHLWLAPRKDDKAARTTGPLEDLARAVKLQDDQKFSASLQLLDRETMRRMPLADYAAYYAGRAQLGLKQYDRARTTLAAVEARHPQGFLSEAVPLAEARAAEGAGAYAAAVAIYQRLLHQTPTDPPEVLLRLGHAAASAGDRPAAIEAFRRVYYDYPLSDQATEAGKALQSLSGPPLTDAVAYPLELARAGTLFQAGRFKEAREAYTALLPRVRDEDLDRVRLRLASCDLALHYYRYALDDARPYVDAGAHQAEGTYDYVTALAGLHRDEDYVRAVRAMVDRFGNDPWVESALNDLGTWYILQDEDDQATATFSEMLARFPNGAHAERAAWKVGWAAYRAGRYSDTIQVFDAAAARFPRSNDRPAYLYWAGRSYEALKDGPLADARYALTATDYLNSYYGRLAVDRLGGKDAWRQISGSAVEDRPSDPPDPSPARARAVPPTGEAIRLLLSAGMYDQAMNELRFARRKWGRSPVVEATIAWVHNREGDLRQGINAMKRAYPQYLAASGVDLPRAILEVLFPLDYWPLIRQYSKAHDLDPYLMAALIAQESTFEPAIRSSAKAVGLMQLLPSTGRHYARVLHYRWFSPRMLTTPATNIRLGMAYFADLVQRFGGVHYALASYNAGENRVSQWIQERQGLGLDKDEFIEDIPFPETQNYVKKILGTAADYRRLYGGGRADVLAEQAPLRPAAVRAVKHTPVRRVRRRAPARRRAHSRHIAKKKRGTPTAARP